MIKQGKHSTFNIQRPTSNAGDEARKLVGHSMLNVECSMFRRATAFTCPVIFALLLLLATAAGAQENGSVSGVVVSSWNAEPLAGVTVTVRGTTLAVQADAAGRFDLKMVPPGSQVLRFSKSGYASAVVTEVRVLPGQNTTVNGNLRPEFYDLEEYEVTAEEFAEQTEKIMFDRQQSASMVDSIGSEQFSKLGSTDAGQIVSRVTGVSVVGGKYVVVRGLSDRYSKTLLNGLDVPSADPYRTSPQLDLFPAAMIDQISVTKTFMPDQPGSTGGGMVNITTKMFPSEPFVKVTMGTSYNDRSNLKSDFLADPSASMSPVTFPKSPTALDPALYKLNGAPNPPGPASRRETPERAQARANEANAVQDLMQKLGTANFAGEDRYSPLNSKFEASAGDTTTLAGHKLGLFGGLNYKKDFQAREGEINRYGSVGDDPSRSGTQQIGNISTIYGGNVNLGYELWEGSQLGFNFLYTYNSDQLSQLQDYNKLAGQAGSLEQWFNQYIEREVYNYQISGTHKLPAVLDSKLEWGVAIADGSQNEPDQRFMNYFVSPSGQPVFGDASLPFPQYPSRYYREIDEHGFNYRTDWTVPLELTDEDSSFKTGFNSSSSSRTYKEQYFTYEGDSGFDLNHPNSYLNDPAYLQYQADYLGGIRTNYNFSRYVGDSFSHPYTASMDVNAVYVMSDVGLLPWLRLIGGPRVEKTDISLNAKYDGKAGLDQTDLLPALSLVVTPITNLNLRLSYGQNVARPSYRELAPVQSYLPDLSLTAVGNPNLQMASVKSYDARIEWFPTPGDVISAGCFYKSLKDPIELTSKTIDDGQVTWINRPEGSLYGMEFEARKAMEFLSPRFKGLTIGGNYTYIKSEAKLTPEELYNKRIFYPNTGDTRPLYDQSPYIINLDMIYEHPTSGTGFMLGANMTGKRIILTKSLGPDLYEHPTVTLDTGMSQKFLKHWELRLGVKNLLDQEYRQTYGQSEDGNVYQSFKRGRTYSISVSATF
jgi:outer membrane receptor protein involved in Fe transport